MTIPCDPQSNSRARGWAVLFALAAIEALLALIYLASLPSDAENGRFFGFSTGRLALLGLLLALAAGSALLAWLARRSVRLRRWLDPVESPRLFRVLFVLLPAAALLSGLIPVALLSIYRTSGNFSYFAYYERLLPLFMWALLVSIQGFAWVAWTGGFRWSEAGTQRSVFRAGLAVWGVMGLAAVVIAVTGIGVQPDVIGWGRPTVALLEWHIWLAWAAGIMFLLLLAYRGWRARIDWLLAGVIWLLAVGLWLSQPVPPSFFATTGRAPNYEIYPFSDGAYYGSFAQSVLIGSGFKGQEVPPRPLYISLLAGFHVLAGQEYERVIFAQTLLLGFFPVVLYFLGKELHSRPAGLMIALLAVLRELNAIITTPITDNASNSKLFFADLPAALAISLWALLVVRWLRAPRREPLMPLLVGGGMGLAMLFRTQSIFMLPVVLLLGLLALRLAWRAWFRALGLVILGLALVIAPWLWRNWQVTGQPGFDDPKSQTGVMAQRYSISGTDKQYLLQPGEDIHAFSARVTSGIINFLVENPGFVARFTAGHLLNAELANLLVLPVRDGLPSPGDLLSPSTPFWESWNGTLTFGQALLLLVNLGLISLGAGAAWSRLGWAGLALLLINLSYNFSNAVARNSGGRYLLPVDWVWYVYASIGLLEIALTVLLVLGVPRPCLLPLLSRRDETASAARQPLQRVWLNAAAMGLLFLLVGSVPPLVERAFPNRYPDRSRAEMAAQILRSPHLQQAGVDPALLERFAEQPGTRLVEGRALYPRYYAAGDGEPRTAKTGYEPLDFPRTLFLVASKDYNGLVMLKADNAPSSLPNAADVYIIGCPANNYLDARAVLVSGEKGGITLAEAGIPEHCPPVEEP